MSRHSSRSQPKGKEKCVDTVGRSKGNRSEDREAMGLGVLRSSYDDGERGDTRTRPAKAARVDMNSRKETVKMR